MSYLNYKHDILVPGAQGHDDPESLRNVIEDVVGDLLVQQESVFHLLQSLKGDMEKAIDEIGVLSLGIDDILLVSTLQEIQNRLRYEIHSIDEII